LGSARRHFRERKRERERGGEKQFSMLKQIERDY
jgi:hypothetical protein